MLSIEEYNAKENTLKEAAEANLKIAQEALLSGDITVYEMAKQKLADSVDEWNKAHEYAEYGKILTTDEPLKKAFESLFITVHKVKEYVQPETKRTVAIAIEPKPRRIDFDKFCAFGELDTNWLSATDRLLALLQLKKVDIYNLKPEDIIGQSGAFMYALRKKKSGETPDSNTQVTKLLQQIVDDTIYVDNGNGQNAHKCTYKDIIFVEDCAYRFDPSQKCGIKSLKPRGFHTVMSSVLHSILTGEGYNVKNMQIKKD